MTAEQKLEILKADLQMTTNANDEYLGFMLRQASEMIKKEGVELIDGNIESDMVVIQYAAYLFRKRAAPETGMPRYLRWHLNNMLFSKKAKVSDDI